MKYIIAVLLDTTLLALIVKQIHHPTYRGILMLSGIEGKDAVFNRKWETMIVFNRIISIDSLSL